VNIYLVLVVEMRVLGSFALFGRAMVGKSVARFSRIPKFAEGVQSGQNQIHILSVE
jgi:hypothetical protein